MKRPSDLHVGAFSDDPPWELTDPAAISWRTGLDRVRERTQQQVPALTRPRTIPPGRRMGTVVRHLGAGLAAWALRERGRDGSVAGLSRRLRLAFEQLGPTYIKLGQIISAGEGVFPPELVGEFAKCRDRVPPVPYSEVKAVVEAELGRDLDEVFAWFSPRPMAAASIAQVHPATLLTGEQVVVKVQRPSVARLVHDDLRVMAWLAPHLVGRIPVAALANPPALVELFAETIVEELDFRLEAQNMLDLARILVELEQTALVVPRPHPELVTKRVLVMERLDGFAFDDVVGMRDAGIDTHAIIRTGMIAFLEGAVLHGVFHGDLHGGNLFVLPDGRTALLDFGITGRLGERRRVALLRLMMSATVNDLEGQLAALRDLGALPPDADLAELIVDLGLDRPPVDPTKLTGKELIVEIGEIVKALMAHGAKLPKELMLFVKDMVFLDGAIARLAPEIDLFAEITHIATHFALKHGEVIARDVGVDPRSMDVDLTGVKASFGLDADYGEFTYDDLRRRRDLIRKRLGDVRR